VILRCLDDRSERDVAEALGVSVGAVKTHFHRGLARLREELGEEVVI
jgi:DNA-directed RNA polymerase specialized sigma24 family protein